MKMQVNPVNLDLNLDCSDGAGLSQDCAGEDRVRTWDAGMTRA